MFTSTTENYKYKFHENYSFHEFALLLAYLKKWRYCDSTAFSFNFKAFVLWVIYKYKKSLISRIFSLILEVLVMTIIHKQQYEDVLQLQK